jgi:hypothetical protein
MGTTGFDADVSWGQLRVEVPGWPRKTTGITSKCGLSRVRPRCLKHIR